MSNLIPDYDPKSLHQWYSKYLDSFEALPPPKRTKARVAPVPIPPPPAPPPARETPDRPFAPGEEVYTAWGAKGNKGHITAIHEAYQEESTYTVEGVNQNGQIWTVRCYARDLSRAIEDFNPAQFTSGGGLWGSSVNTTSWIDISLSRYVPADWGGGVIGASDGVAPPAPRGPLTGNPFHSEVAPLP